MATTRQIIAVKKLAEIIRKSKGQKNVTMGKILREAGYSKSVALHPTHVTESKGFKEILRQQNPPDKVSQLQSDLMEASHLDSYKLEARLSDKEIEELVESVKGCKVRKISRFKSDMFVTVYFWSPDINGRTKALDMFYKLTNEYPKDKEETNTNTAIKEYLDKLSKVLP